MRIYALWRFNNTTLRFTFALTQDEHSLSLFKQQHNFLPNKSKEIILLTQRISEQFCQHLNYSHLLLVNTYDFYLHKLYFHLHELIASKACYADHADSKLIRIEHRFPKHPRQNNNKEKITWMDQQHSFPLDLQPFLVY